MSFASILYHFICFLIYLFLALLGLPCCVGFPLMWPVGGTLWLHCTGFSCEDRLWDMRASVVATCGLSSCSSWALEHRLSSCGSRALGALSHIASSQTKDQTHISFIGRRILYHWAAREAPLTLYLNHYNYEDRTQNRIYVRFWKLWINLGFMFCNL